MFDPVFSRHRDISIAERRRTRLCWHSYWGNGAAAAAAAAGGAVAQQTKSSTEAAWSTDSFLCLHRHDSAGHAQRVSTPNPLLADCAAQSCERIPQVLNRSVHVCIHSSSTPSPGDEAAVHLETASIYSRDQAVSDRLANNNNNNNTTRTRHSSPPPVQKPARSAYKRS